MLWAGLPREGGLDSMGLSPWQGPFVLQARRPGKVPWFLR